MSLNPSLKTKTIGIIGAGPAGLTAAYKLSQNGYKVDVYEISNSVGGMSRSIDLWGQRVDIGPHRFFSKDSRVNNLWLEVVGKDYVMVDRTTSIYYKNQLYPYPLKALPSFINLGPVESTLCILSYLKQKLSKVKPDDSFEGWVTKRFGQRLYEHFFKSYSEKLWGISCKKLDAEFAVQRIKKFSLGEAIKAALIKDNGTKHKTLVSQFAYPNKGTGMVYENMAKKIVSAGSKIIYNTPIKGIGLTRDSAIGIEMIDGTILQYDEIISTMPLPLLVRNIKGLPNEVSESVKNLKFRNTILVYLEINNPNLFDQQWLYIHSPDIDTGRITNFKNFRIKNDDDSKNSILAMEYWCNNNDQIWKESDKYIAEKAKKELIKTKLIKGSKIVNTHVIRVKNSYPVYEIGYKENLEVVKRYISAFDHLQLIGRPGAFKYNNQDHSILMGILAAENIIHPKRKNDLWDINTNYEYHESSNITETGLVND